MKAILTFLLFSIIYGNAMTQVIFFQDFESGVLDPMTAVDLDGKTINLGIANVAGPTFQIGHEPHTQNKSAVSASWFSPPGQADDWLISPPITVTDTNTFLSWRAYTPDASYRDGYQIFISTSDTAIESFSILALNIAAEMTTWTSRNIKLDAYVGQTIYFAFRNNSTDKYLLFIDDIKVEVLKNYKVIVKNLTFEKYNPISTEVPIKITVENHGAFPLTSFLFSYSLGDNEYRDSIKNINILPLKSADVTHSINCSLHYTGEFPVNVILTIPNGAEDEISGDNTASKNIYFLDEPVQKKIVVEESCGTWCGWCPRGIVFTKLVADNYPGIVIPIHIHNGDPMTLPGYDEPISLALGTVYPRGFVDRKSGSLNPEYFPQEVDSMLNRLVPVTVSTSVLWDKFKRVALIKGTGQLTIPTVSNALRFVCVITEDNVTGTMYGYEQQNFYAGGSSGTMGGYESLPNPVPANQMVYNYVSRAILGGYAGMENSIPDTLEANEDFEIEFNYTVPEQYDETQMHAIIFVVDEETGEILNSDMIKLSETTSVPLVPTGHFSAYPNPTKDILNLQVDYTTDAKVTMRIYTPMGQLVRDFGNLDLTNGNQATLIHVADLSSGNYILELRNKNSVTALPFTKM